MKLALIAVDPATKGPTTFTMMTATICAVVRPARAVIHARTEVVRWQIAGDGAARGRSERAAVLLEVVTDTASTGGLW